MCDLRIFVKKRQICQVIPTPVNQESQDQESKKSKANQDKSGKEMERKSSKQSNNTPIQSESVMEIMNNDLNESGDLVLNEQPDRETSFKMFGEGERSFVAKTWTPYEYHLGLYFI